MKKKIKEYIDALCDEYGMDDNKQAKNMLVNDFIAIYEECLKEYDKNCEKAFLKAKELFGTKAIIDKTYRISHNYGYYNKMKKASGLLSINNSATKIYDILRKTIDGEKHE